MKERERSHGQNIAIKRLHILACVKAVSMHAFHAQEAPHEPPSLLTVVFAFDADLDACSLDGVQ